MKNILYILLFLSFNLNAEGFDDSGYFELNTGYYNIDSGNGLTVSPLVLTGTLGANFSENFAGEVFIGGTLVSDSYIATVANSFYAVTSNVDIRLDNIYGFYLKPKLEISPDVNVYLKGGLLYGTLNVSAFGTSVWASDSSISYGAGIQGKISDSAYMGLDYNSFYDKDGLSIYGARLFIGTFF